MITVKYNREKFWFLKDIFARFMNKRGKEKERKGERISARAFKIQAFLELFLSNYLGKIRGYRHFKSPC